MILQHCDASVVSTVLTKGPMDEDRHNRTVWARPRCIRMGRRPIFQPGAFARDPTAGNLRHWHSVGDFPDGRWSNRVVGANPQGYVSRSTCRNWFQHCDGSFTASGSGDVASKIAGNSAEPGSCRREVIGDSRLETGRNRWRARDDAESSRSCSRENSVIR